MSDLSKIAARAATIAMMISSSAAFAAGDMTTGRQHALSALDRSDTLLGGKDIEGEMRNELRRATDAIPGRSRSYSINDTEAKKTRNKEVAAAVDMAAAAGMAARGNDDAVHTLRAIIAYVDDTLNADQKWAIMAKEFGLQIRTGDPSYKMHYEAL